MKLTPIGAAFIRGHEGFVQKLYLCPAGVPTIGIGFTMRSKAFREWWQKNKHGIPFRRGATMTPAEADDALIFLVEREYGKAVERVAPANAPQHAKEAALSMVYNCGPGALKWKWGQAFAKGDYQNAGRLMAGTAVTSKGRRLAGLVRRRKEEALLMVKGKYALHSKTVDMTPQDPAADGILERGERGKAVLLLQRALCVAGYDCGNPDGIFGRGTEAAVMDFQSDNGLVADGKFGPKSVKALQVLDRKKREAKNTSAEAIEFAEGVAAEHRVSSTHVATGVTGIGGAVAISDQINEAAHQVQNWKETIVSLGPWVVLAIGFGFAAWWIWKERQKKRGKATRILALLKS